MIKTISLWLLRIVPAAIFIMTLFFKFTADPQSVKLFTALDMEPWGRIGTGVFELIASVLLLIPRTTLAGAVLGLGLMAGAIFFHLTKLGIYFDGDAGLFTYALISFLCCAVLVIIFRKNIPQLLKLKF
ncbi:MAG: DoxX family protein [Ferruginibacter sp.]